jgi:hypothetical protein
MNHGQGAVRALSNPARGEAQLPDCPSADHNRDLAELHFYDLPLIRPSGFVNSGTQRYSSQELLELLGDGRRYDYHRMLSRFLPIIPNRHVIPLKGS